jgi:hypothetical protein
LLRSRLCQGQLSLALLLRLACNLDMASSNLCLSSRFGDIEFLLFQIEKIMKL